MARADRPHWGPEHAERWVWPRERLRPIRRGPGSTRRGPRSGSGRRVSLGCRAGCWRSTGAATTRWWGRSVLSMTSRRRALFVLPGKNIVVRGTHQAPRKDLSAGSTPTPDRPTAFHTINCSVADELTAERPGGRTTADPPGRRCLRVGMREGEDHGIRSSRLRGREGPDPPSMES